MKNKSKLLLGIALLLTLLVKGQAQERLELSLLDAQTYAINHNKTLKNARLDVSSTDRKIWEVIADGLPQVSGTLDYMTNFGYEIPFSFGGDDAPASVIKMTDQSTAKLQVSQLLFSGQYFSAVQTVKLAKQLSDLSMQSTELDIKESVISTYYMTLITERSLEIIEQNIENLNQTLQQTNAMFKAGMAEKMDVDQISVSVSMLKNNLKSTERNLKLNYNMLRFLLGIEAHVEIKLIDNLNSIIEYYNFNQQQTSDFILEDNLMFQIMASQEELGVKKVDLQKWSYAPTVSGFYTYNQKLLVSGFDLTPKHVMGVNLSLPIFASGKRRAQVDIAKIELEQAQNNKSLMMDQLQLEENQLRFNFNNAFENFEIQKANIEVAKNVLENYRNKYDQGVMSALDLTQANNNYLSAENGYLQALTTLLQARLALDKLKNQL